MAETLLQKAQRLGIKPAGRPRTDIIERKKVEAEKAEIQFEQISGFQGQTKEFVKGLGEISGFTPTARRIAASIAPYIEKPEDFPSIVEELSGGVKEERKIGEVGESLKRLGVNENVAEGIDIALDLPIISLGLSKTISNVLEKEITKKSPELIKFLEKPLTEFTPDALKNVLTKEISLPVEKIKGTFGKIKEKVIGQTEKLLEKPIPKPTETALRETRGEIFDKYVERGEKAALSNKELTPLELAGQRAQEALDQMTRKLNAFGKQKKEVLEKAAVGNKPAGNIVVKFRQRLQNALRNKTETEANQKIYQDILEEAQKLGDNPKAKEVDRFIDFVQDRIYSGQRELAVPLIGDADTLLRPITGELNESLKLQLPESYRNLNQQFSDLVKVRNELNQKLGKEGERGGALMKRVFSPSDANTKKLFEAIEKETGIDLIDEATIARFVMETLGDVRQKSLLEELKLPRLTRGGILEFLFEKIRGQFNLPEKQIQKARKLTK